MDKVVRPNSRKQIQAQMKSVLKYLAGIEEDCTGYSFALVRTIQNRTGLSRAEIDGIVRRAERDGLVESIRTNLLGPDGLISVTITEKGRLWLKEGRKRLEILDIQDS